ncbi:unnamed protein product, partial [Choristocarpus tenellus]
RAKLRGGLSSALEVPLDGDSAVAVSVAVSFTPGASFQGWEGGYLFQGKLRFYESRNEDVVKELPCTAQVYSSAEAYRCALVSNISPSSTPCLSPYSGLWANAVAIAGPSAGPVASTRAFSGTGGRASSGIEAQVEAGGGMEAGVMSRGYFGPGSSAGVACVTGVGAGAGSEPRRGGGSGCVTNMEGCFNDPITPTSVEEERGSERSSATSDAASLGHRNGG